MNLIIKTLVIYIHKVLEYIVVNVNSDKKFGKFLHENIMHMICLDG